MIGAHRDWPDVAYLLRLDEDIAHALVLVLSRLPASKRRALADAFFDEHVGRGGWGEPPADQRVLLAMGAKLALLVLDLTERPALHEEPIVDLLHGAAQGDDLTIAPEPAVDRLRRAVLAVRLDPALDDESDPHAVASLAVVEVLDPSSDGVP